MCGRFWILAFSMAIGATFASPVLAQTYPSKPITIEVAFPARR